MKKFTIRCSFGGVQQNFDVYIGEPARDAHPLWAQMHWLSEERGGRIPDETLDSFKNLHTVAIESKISFEDICEYAVGAPAAEQFESKQPSDGSGSGSTANPQDAEKCIVDAPWEPVSTTRERNDEPSPPAAGADLEARPKDMSDDRGGESPGVLPQDPAAHGEDEAVSPKLTLDDLKAWDSEVDSIASRYLGRLMEVMRLQHAGILFMESGKTETGRVVLDTTQKLRASVVELWERMKGSLGKHTTERIFARIGRSKILFSSLSDDVLRNNSEFFNIPPRPQGTEFACDEAACDEGVNAVLRKYFIGDLVIPQP
jgi:hypothetical protein